MILIRFPEQQICLCLNTVSEICSKAKVKPFLGRPLIKQGSQVVQDGGPSIQGRFFNYIFDYCFVSDGSCSPLGENL